MSRINVIYQFNEKYVPYAGVSITSLLENNSGAGEINIYVLGEGLSDGSKDKLADVAGRYGARMVFPDVSPLLARFKEMGMIPYRGAYSVYLRLFFTEIEEMPSFVGERVIYLDADTIVAGSLMPLLEIDMKGRSIGMVIESLRDDYKVMIGMAPDADYYNSGVILYDVDKWRANRYCDRIVDHITKVRSSYIGDQDFLNIVCSGDVCTLPPVYNFQPLHARYTVSEYFSVYGDRGYYSADEIEEARRDAVIYHCYRWLGEFPWHKGNLHPFGPLFDEYLGRSAWSGYIKEKSSPGIVIRVEKLLYRILPKGIFIRIFRRMHELALRRAEHDARNSRTNARA